MNLDTNCPGSRTKTSLLFLQITDHFDQQSLMMFRIIYIHLHVHSRQFSLNVVAQPYKWHKMYMHPL